MRLRGSHRWWLALALAAAMLLSLLPTVGRLAQAAAPTHEPHDGIAAVALCTVQGLRRIALPPALAQKPPRPEAPAPHPAQDCDYCPLLAGLVALAIVALALWPPALPVPLERFRDAHRIAAHHPSGLGSRGPPLRG